MPRRHSQHAGEQRHERANNRRKAGKKHARDTISLYECFAALDELRILVERPANVPKANDEYDAYLDEIYVMLMHDRADAAAVEAYFWKIATNYMGISPVDWLSKRCSETASRLPDAQLAGMGSDSSDCHDRRRCGRSAEPRIWRVAV